MLSLTLIISTTFVLFFAKCDSVNNDIEENSDGDEAADIPLILTKYIEEGQIERARRLSRVGDLPDAPPLESYSGFITVRKEYNSNIFFWFFPAVNKNASAPVLLWLQGGPGLSGLRGLFVEHGPYIIQENLTAVLREYHWARTYHVIYVDNPVGAGYSFTDDSRGYVTNQGEMAEDMYEFLRQFFIIFHEYRRNDFYIAGQSYGGKWVPSVAHKIHSMGISTMIQLTGIVIGNGFCDPVTMMMNYSEFMYNIGHIDEKQAEKIKMFSNAIIRYIRKDDYVEAHDTFTDLLGHYRYYSGQNSIYNFLRRESPHDQMYYEKYIKIPQFRNALKLGNLRHKHDGNVRHNLNADFMKSAKSNITIIMNHYKVLIYHGQLDTIIPYPSTLNFLKSVDWKHAKEYKTSNRKIWHVKNSTEIAGYVHNVANFYEVMVRNAGHEVPYDKPEVAFDLITRFINNVPF